MSVQLDLVAKHNILVVDDTLENLTLLSTLLKNQYKVRIANSGAKALSIARSESPPDLILLDILMPELSGYDVCKILKDDPATRHIPIIFLTTLSTAEEERKGLGLGAADFIFKPVNPPVMLARVAVHLQLKLAADFMRDQRDYLETNVQQRSRELAAVQDVAILALASVAETRDSESGNHIQRTQHYIQLLATQLQDHPRFSAFLDEHSIHLLFKSAPLHAIGKGGIPDHILLKSGRFEPDEFELMKTHCQLGRDAIARAEQALGVEANFLTYAKEIAYSHQEKWDGSGYPEGLAGDDIPIPARLMAVAHVYDALISRRVYKERMPHEQAVDIITAGRGQHFDPDMVDAFVVVAEQFRQIALQFADSDG